MDPGFDATFLEMARVRLLKEYPTHIRGCLDVVTEEQLWWRPHEKANAIANLILHLAGSNRYHLDHVIGGAPNVRDRDREFGLRGGLSKADLQRSWDEGMAVVKQVLDTLTPPRLTERTERGARPTSVAHVLQHVTHHNALHIGQIIWATKMLAPGSINELLMKPVR